MIVIRSGHFVTTTAVTFALAAANTVAQRPRQQATPIADREVSEPASLTMKVGDTASVKVTAYDASVNVIPNALFRISVPRGVVRVQSGFVRAVNARPASDRGAGDAVSRGRNGRTDER